MNLATIAVRNIQRSRFRTTMTVVAVGVALLAFLVLRTVLTAWATGAEHSVRDRIATRHRVTFAMFIPSRYLDDVRRIEGVDAATSFNWFGAHVPGKEQQFFATFAVDPESFLEVYDEIDLPAEQRQAWLADRRGALVGSALARKFGWKVGDRVTLEGSLYAGAWEFQIDGIYTTQRRSVDQSTFYLHWAYLNERAKVKDSIGWIVSRVSSPAMAGVVSKRIDRFFDPRDIQTLSMSEHALNTSLLGMVSTMLRAMEVVSWVILVIMMLILGNTISMGVRERTGEYGALRAIGFRPHQLGAFIVGESVTLGGLGCALGVALAYVLINRIVGPFMVENFTAFFPYFRMEFQHVALTFGLAVLMAVCAAGIPAYQASRLQVVDALRQIG